MSRYRRRLRLSLSIQSLLFGSGTTRRNQAQDLRFDHHVHDIQQARTRIEPDQRIARLLVAGRVHQHEQRIEECGSGLLEGHPMLVQVRPGLALVPDKCIAVILEVNIHRSEEHTSELQSLMRISYAVFCLKKKNTIQK